MIDKASAMVRVIVLAIGAMFGMAQGENMTCTVVELEAYDFIQLSEHDEYVCYNKEDYTDFVIVEDVRKVLDIGDVIEVRTRGSEVIHWSKVDR